MDRVELDIRAIIAGEEEVMTGVTIETPTVALKSRSLCYARRISRDAMTSATPYIASATNSVAAVATATPPATS